MRTLVLGCTLALGLATFGAMARAQNAPDTGSMAYPEPRSSGEFKRPSGPAGNDMGSMAYPSNSRPGQTVPGSQNTGTDTGSMAYPEPRGTGSVRPDTTR
jgi:hypothetical protein